VGEGCLFNLSKIATEVDESIVRGCETDEGMIHDYQIIPIEILLDRGFAEFA